MASGVEELLDMLFEMIDEAKNVPLSGDKCMIERDRALDLIDDIRSQFPVELSEARKSTAKMCCVVRRRQWLPPMMRSRSLGPASGLPLERLLCPRRGAPAPGLSMTPRLTRIENKMKQRRWKEASSGAALSESGDHGEAGANGDLASPGQPAVLPVSQHIHGPVQHLGRLGPGQLIG